MYIIIIARSEELEVKETPAKFSTLRERERERRGHPEDSAKKPTVRRYLPVWKTWRYF